LQKPLHSQLPHKSIHLYMQTKETPEAGIRLMNGANAIREGLIEAAKANPDVIFFAEGVADPSSVYGTLLGLGNYISKERIIEMPLSENGLVGVAIGTAITGKRPVISFQRVEFALLAMEQIVNNAAKAQYISNGAHNVPIVLRLIVGRGWGQGPEHSQSLENMFALFPGLKVLVPTFPADAKGMIIAAVEDNNPVIIIEHRWCHYAESNVPEGYYTSQIDEPVLIDQGKDITIVASSFMIFEAMRAVECLKHIGYSIDLFDLRVCRPLNVEKISASVEKTGKLITVDLGMKEFGIGAEIVSQVVTNCFDKFTCAPVRIGLPGHPTPSSRGYLKGHYADAEAIIKAAVKMLNINEKDSERLAEELKNSRKDLPIDVPDPKFKGPF